MREIEAGATSQTIDIFVQDSSSITGQGLAGLAYNTAGLTAYYARPKAASVAITLATLAAITTAWSSGGFKEIDATHMKGWYRVDVPDAALATGAPEVNFHFYGAADMAPCPVKIPLIGYDNQSGLPWGIVEKGTAQAYGAATVTLPNGTKARVNDFIFTYSATTGANQLHQIFSIDASVPTAKVATVDPPFDETITGTLVCWIFKGGRTPTVNLPTTLASVGTGSGQLDLSSGKVSIVSTDRTGIRKNVAFPDFAFEMLDSVTKSPVAGKTVTVTRRLNNGSFAAGTLSAVSDIGGGGYSVDFAAADMNGESVTLRATASGCDTTFVLIATDP